MFNAFSSPQPSPVQPRLPSPYFQPATPGTGAGTAELPLEVLTCVLDEMDYGVVLVDAQRTIRHTNHLGRFELGSRRSLHAAAGRLMAALPALQEALVQAVQPAQAGQRSMVDLGSAQARLPVACIPLRPGLDDAEDAILVVCGKRQLCDALGLQFFARSARLSPGETTVLQALCSGLKPEAIAQQNGVCVSTVRSQVISIRQKTGTHSVRDLVNRVSALPPMVPSLRMGALQ